MWEMALLGSLATGFSPVTSKLEWKIAEWVIKDGLGHTINCLIFLA
jgi:hypothetical protein